jgi:hypothetical protein
VVCAAKWVIAKAATVLSWARKSVPRLRNRERKPERNRTRHHVIHAVIGPKAVGRNGAGTMGMEKIGRHRVSGRWEIVKRARQ